MSAGHAIEAVKTLANELAAPTDPDYKDYKDDWERGYDAGREAAGRDLVKQLQQMGFME